MSRMALVLLLAGCAGGAQETADALMRQQAEAAITRTIEARLPGVPAAPIANCVVDNATTDEIISLATTGLTGPSPDTVNTVMGIATRPATRTCILNNGLPLAAAALGA